MPADVFTHPLITKQEKTVKTVSIKTALLVLYSKNLQSFYHTKTFSLTLLFQLMIIP
jgi:hypothetical protein